MRRDERNKGILLAAAGVGAIAAARGWARRRRTIEMRGRVALITGGSRGLGLILARQLLAEGAQVAICARDADELDRAQRHLGARRADLLPLVCDVTRREEVEATVSRVEAHYGPIDVLINNAGVVQVGPMEEMTEADYDEAMRTHFWGPFYAVQAVLRTMRARRFGRIVNISSIGGKVSIPHMLPYSASKFALVGFSEGLRAELAKYDIHVTTVCPGLIRTGSPRNAFFKGQNRKEYAWFSLGDSLPITSMSAERAAAQIVEAARHGDAELVTSLPAKIVATAHAVAPGVTADVFALVARVLPGPGGIGAERRQGSESESPVSPSILTALSDRAAERNNEMP